jgi:hypothetical protein
MKSQTSLETLVIMAILIVILLVILIFNTDLTSTYTTRNSREKIKNTLEEISYTAEMTYAQGQGSKNKIYISLPNIILNSSIFEKTLRFNVYSSLTEEGFISIDKKLNFNITGNLPNGGGNYWITIESHGGFVNVTY